MRPSSNRLKVIRISALDVVKAVYGMRNCAYRVVGCTCLPEGFVALQARTESWVAGPPGIDVLVEHPSFDEVPDGEEVPRLRCNCYLNVVQVEDADRPELVRGDEP